MLDADKQRLSVALAAIPRPVEGVDPAIIREAWDSAMTLDERRAVVELFIDRVDVQPAKPGTRHFDPDRVGIIWRSAP